MGCTYSVYQLLILILQTFKSILQVDDVNKPFFVSSFIIDHRLKECRKLFMSLEILFFFFEQLLLLRQFFLEFTDLFLLLLNFTFFDLKLFLLVFTLKRILLELLCLFRNFLNHLLLLLLVCLFLLLQFTGSCNDILFLTCEIFISISFFSLLLKKSYSLQRSLTLNNMCSDFI